MNLRESLADQSNEKERIRLEYLKLAESQEKILILRANQQNSEDEKTKSRLPTIGCGTVLIASFVATFFSAHLTNVIFVGGIIILIAWYSEIKRNNRERIKVSDQMKQEYWRKYEKMAQEAIETYDRERKVYYSRVIQNEAGIEDMCSHMIDMFNRMIGNASSESNQKFIDATLHFIVYMDGIKFFYDSQYTNKLSDYNFDVKRFRNLTSMAQCEGLAHALTKITVRRMKMIYPPDTIKLDISHNDADVKIRFRGPNMNYIPPRPIA